MSGAAVHDVGARTATATSRGAIPVGRPAADGPSAGNGQLPRAEGAGDRRPVPRRDLIKPDRTGPVVLGMSLGLLVLAWCVHRGLGGADPLRTDTLYWVAQVMIFAPAAWRILTPGVSERERTAVALALGLLTQLGRTVLYPKDFAFHDELVHGNLLRLILDTHQAFPVNSALPVTSSYPGLEVATAAVVSLTGLSLHTSAVLVLLLARVVLVLAVRGVVRALTGSDRMGSVAVLVYACNPQFVFFNSQFSYQTIALPLGLLATYLVLTRGSGRRRLVLPMAVLTALAVSHHLTSFLFTGAFAAWWLVELVLSRRRVAGAPRDRGRRCTVLDLGLLTLVSAGVSLVFALRVGNPVGSYLTAIADLSADNVHALSEGQPTNELFADPTGVPTPDWQRALLVVALALTSVAVIAGVLRGRRWLRDRNAPALLLLVFALGWPLVPAGHLTEATSEVTDRSAGFIFVGVAFTVAAANLLLPRNGRWSADAARHVGLRIGVVALVVATFVGNTVLGIGPIWARVPGPYLVSADNRSIDGANLASARWLAATQAPNGVLFGDRVSGLLGSLIGRQTTLRHVGSEIDASPLLLQSTFGATDRELIRRASIRWVVVDTRDSTGLPHLGVYVENGEYLTGDRTSPVPAAALTKLAAVPGVRRVYDNGALVVYDVAALAARVPVATPAPRPRTPSAPTAAPTPAPTPAPSPLLTILPPLPTAPVTPLERPTDEAAGP